MGPRGVTESGIRAKVIKAQDAHSLDQVAEHPKCTRVSLVIVRNSRETYGGLLSMYICMYMCEVVALGRLLHRKLLLSYDMLGFWESM